MDSMKHKFNQIILKVEKKYETLINSSPFKWNMVPRGYEHGAGIYLFSKNNKPLYVGRTNNLKRRLRNHTRPSHNMATFAFLLARHTTKRFGASYRPVGSREHLLRTDKKFRKAFDDAREQIKKMNVQFVEEPDAVSQALLEIYAAYVSKAQYNDFDTH